MLLAVFAAVFLTYQPVWQAGFIWNDSDYITAAHLRSLPGLARIWFEVGATEQYYPVLHTSFWLQHKLWGDVAAGYHLVNIALHASAAGLLGLVLRRLGLPGAWLAALIFALHPVCVESVAWVAEQKNTLSLVLYLAAALAHLRFDENRQPKAYALAILLFVMALLAKSVTATLPPALLVVAWWRRGNLSWRQDIAPLAPWFVLGAAAGLFTAWVERRYIGAEGADFDLTLLERVFLAGRIVWFYLGKIFWPAELIFIYPRWHISAAEWSQSVFTVGVVAALAVMWWARRQWRGPLAAALLFIGSLFPVLGFFNVYAFVFSYVADHWQYLPMIGVIAACSALATRIFAAGGAMIRAAGVICAIGLLVLLSAMSWRQNRMYRDIETFYQVTIDKNPACWMARINLGNLLVERGQHEAAIAQYEAALRSKPGYAKAHFALGTVLAIQHRMNDAVHQFEETLRLQPAHAKAHLNLGSALATMGRLREAEPHFFAAAQLRPDLPEAHVNLAFALLDRGALREALPHLETAARLDPSDSQVRETLRRVRADLVP